MRVISFDPGEQTGVAVGVIEDGRVVVEHHGWDRWVDAAYRYKRGADDFDHCVYESWLLTKRGAKNLLGSDMPWSQFIGMMKMISWDHGTDLTRQEPADKYWLDAVMGGTDYLPKSEVEHNRDALRHLFIYAIRNHGVATFQYETRTVEVPREVVPGRPDDGLPGV